MKSDTHREQLENTFYTLEELALLLRRSKAGVMALLERGALPQPLRLGGSQRSRMLWRKAEVRKLLGLAE